MWCRLFLFSTQGSCELQEEGLMQSFWLLCRVVFGHWFGDCNQMRDWQWLQEQCKMLSRLSRGELGPSVRHVWWQTMEARHNPPGGPVSLAKGLLAEKWLVSMAVLPSDRGRPVMKPKTIWDQGWLGGEVRAGFHRLPVCSKQVEMKALVSASMDGQQNCWWRVFDWYQDGSWSTSICWWGQGGTVKSSKTSKVVALELRFQFQGPDVSIILYTWLYLQYSYKCPWLRFNY